MIKGLKITCLAMICFAKAYSQNYDESKVPAYTLPEILKTSAGKTVSDRSVWEKTRRPEILSLFEENVYGKVPRDFDSIRFSVSNDVPNALNGKAHLKEVTITVWRINKPLAIHLVLFTPNAQKKPASVFLLINNRGKENMDPERKVRSEFWPVEMGIEKGYAMAAFQVADAAPDNKDTYQNGVLQLYPELISANNGMKAIGSWAWAASRVMDYFKTNKDIDFSKVSLVGHSRGGKTALWAGAEDQRFAMIFASCSGNTGASLSRRQYGETVKKINTGFPYWFTTSYRKFGDDIASLPVDQHMLISLIAPRPVYTTNAMEDLWADPRGSYLTIQHAQTVYSLYGKRSALTAEPPPVNSPIIKSIIGYHIRNGIHNMIAYDWANFIKFADYHYFGKQGLN